MHFSRRRFASWAVDALHVALVAAALYWLYTRLDEEGIIRETTRHIGAIYYSEIPTLLLAAFIPSYRPNAEVTRARIRSLPDANWIRLCKFLNNTEDGLAYSIWQGPFATAPPYRALSYTWGPAEGSAIDDEEFSEMEFKNPDYVQRVPVNLRRALVRLRIMGEDSWFWIDSICINQQNPVERSEQVNIMDKIYSKAVAADVWLGRSNTRSEQVVGVLEHLSSMSKAYGNVWSGIVSGEERPSFTASSSLLSDDDWEALSIFCSQRWFHRLWTLQEFALAKEVRMIWGEFVIDAETLYEAALFLYSSSLTMKLKYGRVDDAGAAIAHRGLLRFLVEHPDRFPQVEFLLEQLPDYETVLACVYWRSAATYVSDPRDYVYGILGVARTLMDGLIAHYRSEATASYQPIKADYKLTVAQVYQMFTTRLMQGSIGIRAVALIQPGPEWEFQSRQRQSNLDLPSWVPNLSDRNRFALSNEGALKPQAHDVMNIFAPHILPQKFSIHGRDLHAYGRRIGAIRRASRPFPYEANLKYCGEFGFNLIRVLTDMPAEHYSTSNSPIQSLIMTLALERASSLRRFARENPKPWHIENFLLGTFRSLVWTEIANDRNRSVDGVLNKWPLFHELQSIHGLSARNTSAEVARWRDAGTQIFAWNPSDYRGSIRNGTGPLIESCMELTSACAQAKGQKICSIRMDAALQRSEDRRKWGNADGTVNVMAMASDMSETDDEIWAMQGSEWPFLLRRCTDKGRGTPTSTSHSESKNRRWNWSKENKQVPVYRFLGEACVHGLMHGELLQYHGEKAMMEEMEEVVLR